MEKINCQKKQYAILFKINSVCNDFCSFCLEYRRIRSKEPFLSLQEFQKNYFYFEKKFNPEYIILTGGEPTLHPSFFKMLDFLKKRGKAFRFITNLLKFNEKDFLNNLKHYFINFENRKQENLTKIIASINDLPERNLKARQRFNGLKKSLKIDLPLIVTTVIYRNNIKNLPKLSQYLINLFEKYTSKSPLSLELRLIYIEGTLSSLLKISLPKNFQKIKKSVEDSIKIINDSGASITLWNFPLCYLDNPERITNRKMGERQDRQLIKVHKSAQLKKAEIRDWKVYLKSNQVCQQCKFNNSCSGIDQDYIKKYNFPKLQSLI